MRLTLEYVIILICILCIISLHLFMGFAITRSDIKKVLEQCTLQQVELERINTQLTQYREDVAGLEAKVEWMNSWMDVGILNKEK